MSRRYEFNLSRGDIIALWEFLAHGEQAHREWLLEAIEAFFENRPRPIVK